MMAMARTGTLRDRIEIRRRTETKNEGGGLAVGWETIATLWAEIKSINGREAVIGQVLQGISMFQVTIRHRTDLKAGDQILWLTADRRELNIVAPPEDRLGDRRWTVIQASTQAQQGA